MHLDPPNTPSSPPRCPRTARTRRSRSRSREPASRRRRWRRVTSQSLGEALGEASDTSARLHGDRWSFGGTSPWLTWLSVARTSQSNQPTSCRHLALRRRPTTTRRPARTRQWSGRPRSSPGRTTRSPGDHPDELVAVLRDHGGQPVLERMELLGAFDRRLARGEPSTPCGSWARRSRPPSGGDRPPRGRRTVWRARARRSREDPSMRSRRLGALEVPALGYGAMVLSPGMYGATDDDAGITALHHLIDARWRVHRHV